MDDLPDSFDTEFDVDDPASDPEIVDVPMEEIAGIGEKDKETDLVDKDATEILKEVLSKGSVMFSEGRMLTKCPAYSDPAICGMYPMPHPQTGDTTMVCTGPTVSESLRVRIFGENTKEYTSKSCHYDCPYHPKRLNEQPEYNTESEEENNGGWL